MATKTSFLGLTKPAYTDAADVQVLNNNFDIIEKALGARSRAFNILDNSYFLDPVNQRGTTSRTGIGYSIDRWKAYHDQTIHEVTSSGIKVSSTDGSNPNLYQVLDTKRISGNKTYTAAACDSAGNVYVWSGKVTESVSTPVGVYHIGNDTYLFRLVGEKTWVWAAMYEGSYTVDTLPTYQYKGYAAELLECQRYAIALGGVYRYRSTQLTSSIIDFNINLPVQMRARPSFSASSLSVLALPGTLSQDGFAFAIVQDMATGITIRATKVGHGLTDALLSITTGAIFSADR